MSFSDESFLEMDKEGFEMEDIKFNSELEA